MTAMVRRRVPFARRRKHVARASYSDVGASLLEVITPTVYETQLNSTNGLISSLDRDMQAQRERFTDAFVHDWTAFRDRWVEFYNEHANSPWSSAFFSSSYDQILRFDDEARGWREALVSAGGHATAPLPPSPHPGDDGAPSEWASLAKGLLVVGGIFAVGYALRSVL